MMALLPVRALARGYTLGVGILEIVGMNMTGGDISILVSE